MKISSLLFGACALVGGAAAAATAYGAPAPLLLLRHPTMSATTIVFEYGDELWKVARTGGTASVLVAGMKRISDPIFSPNGEEIAFTGTQHHNTDVYVVSAHGGAPVRLTYWPGPDTAVGWTRDGNRVLFRSTRTFGAGRLYTVSIGGGMPAQLPMHMAQAGSYSPSGTRIAYVPNSQWEPFWKDYKGGQFTQIWISNLSSLKTTRIPALGFDEDDPMWVGNKIYFLSTRDSPSATLFSYDVGTRQVRELVKNNGFDVTSATAGPGGIVYSQFGQIKIYNTTSGVVTPVNIAVNGPLPREKPHFRNVSKYLLRPSINAETRAVAFQANGDIVVQSPSSPQLQDLTKSPGVMDRNPVWSPNGKEIAYFSNRNGEYDLCVRASNGTGSVERVVLHDPYAYYYHLVWSPSGNSVVFNNQKAQLLLVNLKDPAAGPKVIATGSALGFYTINFQASWSPDGKWIAYDKMLANQMHAVFVYSVASGHTHRVTFGEADAKAPVFSRNGKYLLFLASTNSGPAMSASGVGPQQVGTDILSLGHPVTYHLYAAVLEPGVAAPLPKQGAAGSIKASDGPAAVSDGSERGDVGIDFAGLRSRTVALPAKARNYTSLHLNRAGTLYLEAVPRTVVLGGLGSSQPLALYSYQLNTGETHRVINGVSELAISNPADAIAYVRKKTWYVRETSTGATADKLDTKGDQVWVVPKKEWADIYDDAWRIQHAFFYSPIFDGYDIKAAQAEFQHYLPGIASRSDLTFLLREMMSYMSVGHMFIRPRFPRGVTGPVGLLGAEYTAKDGRYQISRILTPGQWNPTLRAPLDQPGLDVKVGDFLLAVNGKAIHSNKSIYYYFQGLAKKVVTLTVGPKPTLDGSHTIKVKTLDNTRGLLTADWIQHNKQTVTKLSDGKLGYVYLPNTNWQAWKNFNKMFFAQSNKDGIIIDERFNGGGLLSEYFIQRLLMRPRALMVTRWGERKTTLTPGAVMLGPKVMVINQFSGSGGDALPWYFKMAKVGPLVGVRTWGGLIGIFGYPPLMDDGSITSPRIAVEGLNGHFPVENHGVSPTDKVWQNPELVHKGADPQLDAAVSVALQQLKEHPLPVYKRAPWRNYHLKLPPLPASR